MSIPPLITLEDIGKRLFSEERIAIAFPPCADIFLSEIDEKNDTDYDAAIFFNNYFERIRHPIFTNQSFPSKFSCGGNSDNADDNTVNSLGGCLPPSCVTLRGIRGSSLKIISPADRIKRLFLGDLVWLFYFDRMGIFKILGAILDDFASKGRFPLDISNSNNELTSIILEAMVRQTKTGLSSTVRDRENTYRRVIGWTSESGRKLSLDSQVNNAFNNLFHKFIQNALIYYNDRRLATAIQGTAANAKPSTQTLVSIGNNMILLKRSFEPFLYGRNYSNTLNGLVWVIATVDLVKNMRSSLGIPARYEQPYEFIPAPYDILVAKRSITPSEENSYELYKTCAENGRDLLLDIEVLDEPEMKEANETGHLATWLNLVENRVEAYRTAYRIITGVDLGEKGTPRIEGASLRHSKNERKTSF